MNIKTLDTFKKPRSLEFVDAQVECENIIK